MSRNISLAAAVALGFATPVAAQQAPAQSATVETGATVYGSDGVVIGTVARTEGDVVLLEVGQRAVPIPRSAVGPGEKGPTINITRDALVSQFDQQMAAYEAKLETAVTAGAAVQTADGKSLGVIEEASVENVVVSGGQGTLTLPRQLLALDQQGNLIARATMDQIKQAMTASPEQG